MAVRVLKEDIVIEDKWNDLTLTEHSGFLIAVKDIESFPTITNTEVPQGTGYRLVATGRTGKVPAGFGEASGTLRAEYALYKDNTKIDLSKSNLKQARIKDINNQYKNLQVTTDTTIWALVQKEPILYVLDFIDGEQVEVKLENKYLANDKITEIVIELGIDSGAVDSEEKAIILPIERHALKFDIRNNQIGTFTRFTNLPKDIKYRIVSATSQDYGYLEAGKDEPLAVSIDLNISEVAFS